MRNKHNDKYQAIRNNWFTKYGRAFIDVISLTNLSLKEKALILNVRGIPTITGKTFSRTNLHSFIHQIKEECTLCL